MEICVTKMLPVLAEMGIRNPVCSLIRSKAGISLFRVESEGKKFILKIFERLDDAREIDNYLLLSKLGIPTLPLLGYTKNAILLPDLAASTEYRPGMESDLNDVQVARAIAKWYRELHAKGTKYLAGTETSMYDETDALTLANMEIVAEKTGTEGNALWRAIADNYPMLRKRIDDLPRTFTYNDFYYTNLTVAKDRKSALMFDYNLLGKGMAYSDIRNVTSSLSYEAAEAFKAEYGIGGLEDQAKADAFISPLVTLYFACECEKFPSWANTSLAELMNGGVTKHLNDWLNTKVDS